MNNKILINGGCGFLGSNLAAHGIKSGYQVTIFDNLSRMGSTDNLKWLRNIGKFDFIHGDIRNKNDVTRMISKFQPDTIFHLAGQVAMTTSLDNPYMDFEVNACGSLNVLEAVRTTSPESAIIYSSTNKVYGDLEYLNYKETESRYECIEYPNGYDESVKLDFASPYGCSKGAADQYMKDYAKMFGIKTVVFRHSSMYGGRQFSTFDQGWVGWFCQKALEAKNNNHSRFTVSGNGKQVRDVLHARDMISLYYTALDNINKISGQVFNVGGGMGNSLSLLELFKLLEELTVTTLRYEKLPVRESDQKIFVADLNKISKFINWRPEVSARQGVNEMLVWLSESLY